jgi:hypothetical protein
MKSLRINAVVVGVLFILGTTTGIAAAIIEAPILGAPDYLAQMPANAGSVTLGAFLQFLMGMSCAGMGIALYPVMKTVREGQAIAVAGFRVIEGTIQVITAAGTMCLLGLGLEYAKATSADQAIFQSIGSMIKTGSDWLNNGPVPLFWCAAALLYYSAFYQYKILPRWLSGWGLVGIILSILFSLCITLDIVPTIEPFQMIVNLPILVQELVFAVWLIVKGYASPAAAPKMASFQTVRVS